MPTTALFNGAPVTVGDHVTIIFTLTTDGAATNITSATITSSLKCKGREVMADHTVAITTAASGICTLSIIPGDWPTSAPEGEYECDVKAVLSGPITRHFGPYLLNVRRAIT